MKTFNLNGLEITLYIIDDKYVFEPAGRVLQEYYKNCTFKDVMIKYKNYLIKPRVITTKEGNSKNIGHRINNWIQYVYLIHKEFIETQNMIKNRIEFWEKDFNKFKEFQAGEEITGIAYGNIKHIVAYSKDGLFELNRRIDLNNGEVEDTIEFNGDLNNLVNLLKSAYDDKCNKPN